MYVSRPASSQCEICRGVDNIVVYDDTVNANCMSCPEPLQRDDVLGACGCPYGMYYRAK